MGIEREREFDRDIERDEERDRERESKNRFTVDCLAISPQWFILLGDYTNPL
jgi:hypothetical protein